MNQKGAEERHNQLFRFESVGRTEDIGWSKGNLNCANRKKRRREQVAKRRSKGRKGMPLIVSGSEAVAVGQTALRSLDLLSFVFCNRQFPQWSMLIIRWKAYDSLLPGACLPNPTQVGFQFHSIVRWFINLFACYGHRRGGKCRK